MKTMLPALLLAAVACAAGCNRAPAPDPAAAPLEAGLNDWILPTPPGSSGPDLALAPDGRLLLSWTTSVAGRRTQLQYADLGRDGRWQGPKTIAVGSTFAMNWADAAHIAATGDGTLWVQWLQKHGDSGEARNVLLSNSHDNGMNWNAPVQPHDDQGEAEHGFVSLWPVGDDAIGIAWLDGRDRAGAMPEHTDSSVAYVQHAGEATAGEKGGGATALRAATFDGQMRIANAAVVDRMTCDCCQTGAAVTPRGTVLAWRGRTPDEVRDIRVARFDGRQWTAPKTVADDGWKIEACPVNGPAIAAAGNMVLVGWYTAAGDTPAVRIARSADAGGSFSAATTVQHGAAVQGHVAVALDARQAWVAWLQEDTGVQSLWLARYAPDLSRELGRQQVARLATRGHASGVPRIVLRDGVAYLAWTDIVDGAPQVRGARFVAK